MVQSERSQSIPRNLSQPSNEISRLISNLFRDLDSRFEWFSQNLDKVSLSNS